MTKLPRLPPRLFSLAVLAVVSVAAVRTAHAGEVRLGMRAGRVDVTSTTSTAWHTNNEDGNDKNDNYAELLERLNVTGSYESFTVAVRLDTATFLKDDGVFDDRYTPEKLWGSYVGRHFELQLGDAYVSFGRGLALSLRKVDELGVDTTVRGAKLLVHSGPVDATAVAGYLNIQNLDEISGNSVDDPLDLVGGASFQLKIGSVQFGGHGAMVAFHESLEKPLWGGQPGGESYGDRYLHAGPTVSIARLPVGKWGIDALGLYLEGVTQLRWVFEPTEKEHVFSEGYGTYGSATVYAGRATVLLEAKAYGDLEVVKPPRLGNEFEQVAYSNLPTVERIAQEIVHPQRDIVGGRARFDWAFSPALLAFASYGLFRDYEDYGFVDMTVDSSTIHDP
ncbi:MAG: hypothetical protein V2A73_09845, partial [Pseudomonadota bacterium]